MGLALLAPGCVSDGPTDSGVFSGVIVLPATVQLRVGLSAPLRAGVFLPEGMPRAITWSTSDDKVVSLEFPTDSSVVVLGRAPGTASVIAAAVADPASKGVATVHVSSQ
jgi:uncharacterized protein YjdB